MSVLIKFISRSYSIKSTGNKANFFKINLMPLFKIWVKIATSSQAFNFKCLIVVRIALSWDSHCWRASVFTFLQGVFPEKRY